MKKKQKKQQKCLTSQASTLLLTGLLSTPLMAAVSTMELTAEDQCDAQATLPDGSLDTELAAACRAALKTIQPMAMIGTSSIETSSIGTMATLDDKFIKIRTGTYASDIAATAGESGIAIGGNAQAIKSAAIAIGGNTRAGEEGAVALGANSKALGTHSSALGDTAEATGYDSTAVGYQAVAQGARSIAIGNGSSATGPYAVALGPNSSASERGSMALGIASAATGEASLALGWQASAPALKSIALGVGSVAEATDSLTLGYMAKVQESATGSVAVGYQSVASEVNTVSVGNDTTRRRIVRVEDGRITSGSADAVTGGQLHTTNTELSAVSGRVLQNEADIYGIGDQITTIHQDIVDIRTGGGGLVTIDGTTGDVKVATDEAGLKVDMAGTGGARVIEGVAAGALSSTSTQAVNGAQLFATNTAVGELTGRVTANEAGIGNITGDITTIQQTITELQDGGVGLVTIDDTTGNVKVASDVGGGVVQMGGSAGARVLDGVAAGALSSTSTEAVNGAQLFATNTAVSDLGDRVSTNETNIGGINTSITDIRNDISNIQSGGIEGLVKHDTDTGLTTVAASNGGDAVSIEGTDGARRLTGIANGIDDADAVSIAQLKAAGAIDPTTGATLTVLTYDDLSLARATLGGTGGTVLDNLAAGRLAADSSEAVNGAQLFATNTAVGELDGRVTANETGIGNITGDITALQQTITQLENGGVGLVTIDDTTGNVKVASDVGGGVVQMAGTGGARVLDGVAAGALSSTSTEAVNGAQLFATNTAVGELDGRVTANETGIGNITGDITTIQQTITELQDGGVGLVTIDDTTGNVKVASDVGGGVVQMGGSAGARVLDGVAAGALSSTSTEAVNGAQLFATNTAVSDLGDRVSTNETNIGGISTSITDIRNDISNIQSGGIEGLVKHDTATGLITVAASNGGDAVSIEGTDGARRLTGIANGIDDADAVSIAQLKAAGAIDPTTGETLTVLTYDDLSLARATLGGTGGTVLDNLAAGRLAADSTEAVNGAQLFATNTAVGELDGRVAANETNIGGINTDITTLQQTISELQDGGVGLVTIDGTTGNVKVASDVGGGVVQMGGSAGARVLDGVAAGALSSTSTQAVNGAQLFATNTAVSNLTGRVTTNEGGIGAIQTDIGAIQDSIAAIVGGDGGYGLVKHDAATGVTTIAAEEGGDVVSVEGEDGNRRLTGIANGTEDSDAVSIAQLKAAGAIDPTTGEPLTVLTYDDLSLARATLGGTNGTVLANLANGLVATGSREAVNGGQLWDLQQGMQAQLDLIDGRVASIEQGVADGSIGGGFPGNVDDGSVSIGDGSAAEGDGSTAVGGGSSAPGEGSTAVGDGSAAPGDGSTAVGGGSTAPGEGSTSVGGGSSAPGDGSTAVGGGSTAPGDGSTAVGGGSSAPGEGSTAVGGGSAADGSGSVAVGEGSGAKGEGSTAVGGGSAADGSGSVAVGEGSGAKGEGSTAVGGGSAADGSDSVAVGGGSAAPGDGAVAIGSGSKAPGEGSVAVGEGSAADGSGSVAIGDGSSASGGSGVAVGEGSSAGGSGSVAIGNGSKAPGNGAVAVGDGAAAEGDNATAIGNGSSATGHNSVAIGAGSVADRDNVVSVGAAGAERQITHVADGTAPTDAVNVRQLDDRFAQANAHTETRYRMVNERIDRMGAMSAAYAGMALNTAGLPGNNRIGVGIGAQSGREALAVGYQRVMGRRSNISVSLGGAFSGSDRSITAGTGISW